MSDLSINEPADRQDRRGAHPTEMDRPLLLAIAAWGNRCDPANAGHRSGDIARDFIERVRNWLPANTFDRVHFAFQQSLSQAHSSDPERALVSLREMHKATARVDLARVHSSWLVRALREESPAVQRVVVASFARTLREPLQAGLLLDSQDIVSERAANPEVADWVYSLWSERLFGGEAARPDDQPAVIAMSRLSPRAGYRLCRQAGICKRILGCHGDDKLAHKVAQRQREWLESRLVTADLDLRARALRDIESSQVSRLPPGTRAARIGLTTIARLLAAAEPSRSRWALQHWPYAIAKLIRSLMPPSASRTPALLQGETLILKTAWERLNLEGRLELPWPGTPELEARSRLT